MNLMFWLLIEKETQPVTNTNEPYVTRCYTMDREFIKGMLKSLSLNPRPFLDLDYELFIVQNLEPSVAQALARYQGGGSL